MQVVDMQKFWVFDGTPGTHKYAIMEEACKVLQKSITLIHEKAEVRFEMNHGTLPSNHTGCGITASQQYVMCSHPGNWCL